MADVPAGTLRQAEPTSGCSVGQFQSMICQPPDGLAATNTDRTLADVKSSSSSIAAEPVGVDAVQQYRLGIVDQAQQAAGLERSADFDVNWRKGVVGAPVNAGRLE